MSKTGIILCSMLLFFSSSAEVYEFDNFIEYDQPSISLPYPYQVVEPFDQSISVPYSYQAVEPLRPAYNNNRGKIIVPASTEVVTVVEPAGFISTAISCVFNVVKSAAVFIITHIPALVTGIAGALGLCKITSFCDSKTTIYEAQTELRSFATPERISRAVDLVKEALRKYSKMQKN